MRLLDYATDRPLRRVAVLLTPPEAEALLQQLQAILAAGSGYVRLEDDEWGELDCSLYTPEILPYLHRRSRRLVELGE
jgi:hypothetical protein